MTNRTIRVNELIKREISDILHKKYQGETVTVTVNEVRVSPDFHAGWVFVSILGDEETIDKKLRWLKSRAREIRAELGRRIVLKSLPRLEYRIDHKTIRGTRILQLLDEVARQNPPDDVPEEETE